MAPQSEKVVEHQFEHHGDSKVPGVENLTEEGGVDPDVIDKARVLGKMDSHLIPTLAILYLLSFLDRGNIGNAKIQGMLKDVNLTGDQYNICITVFFFTYAAFELPSNLLLKRFRPSVWLPSIVVAWGICTVCLGLVHNYTGLLVARIFLGACEAGLYPGVAYYLTTWYHSSDLGFRQGMFLSAASLAGAFSGLLAYCIAKMDGVGGYAGWRWIFILEGLLTIVVAVVTYFMIYDDPSSAKFLTKAEQRWVINRLKYQGSSASGRLVAESEKFSWKYVKKAVLDWQIWLNLLTYWGTNCPLYGISFFLPTIINELGYAATMAQLLTIPTYIGAVIMTILLTRLSDRSGQRAWYLIVGQVFMLVGFILALAGSATGGVPGVVYAGVFLATCGTYPAFVLNVTWIATNLAPSYKRAAGMALQIGLGNMGGAMSANFYRTQDSPKFILGHALEIGFIVLGLLATITQRTLYTKINRSRDRRQNQESHLEPEDLSEQGDRALTFRYHL